MGWVSGTEWRTNVKVQIEQNGCEGVMGTPPVTDRTRTASYPVAAGSGYVEEGHKMGPDSRGPSRGQWCLWRPGSSPVLAAFPFLFPGAHKHRGAVAASWQQVVVPGQNAPLGWSHCSGHAES